MQRIRVSRRYVPEIASNHAGFEDAGKNPRHSHLDFGFPVDWP